MNYESNYSSSTLLFVLRAIALPALAVLISACSRQEPTASFSYSSANASSSAQATASAESSANAQATVIMTASARSLAGRYEVEQRTQIDTDTYVEPGSSLILAEDGTFSSNDRIVVLGGVVERSVVVRTRQKLNGTWRSQGSSMSFILDDGTVINGDHIGGEIRFRNRTYRRQ